MLLCSNELFVALASSLECAAHCSPAPASVLLRCKTLLIGGRAQAVAAPQRVDRRRTGTGISSSVMLQATPASVSGPVCLKRGPDAARAAKGRRSQFAERNVMERSAESIRPSP